MKTPALLPWCMVVFFVAGSARAQDDTAIPAPMPVNARPSPFACTLEKVLSGERCLYEAEPAASSDASAQAKDNVAQAGAAAARSCARAATLPGERTPDAALRGQCEKQVATAAFASCSLDGSAALQDAQGRLGPAARGCVDQLTEAVAHTAAMARVGLSCCRCLARERCPVATLTCADELASHSASAPTQACLAKSCHDACAFAPPASPQPQQGAPRPAGSASHEKPDKI